jgi:glycosyltransferase involved in cell wall biosynthesis
MKVSVLMAVYNGADVVQAAVDSILTQTYSEWELLIIDDASTDGTLPLLHELAAKEPRIKIICNKVNRGLATSLNTAWKLAKGDLLARTDADDASMPERLERQVKFMESHPEVAVLGTGAELVDKKGRFLGMGFRPEQHDALVKNIYRENPFMHSSVMLRKNFYEAMGGYDERLRRAQDYDLWLRSYRRFQFHNLQEPLIRHRVRQPLSVRAILSGTFVMAYNAYREGCLLTRGWYALRFFAAATSTKMGLMDMRTR